MCTPHPQLRGQGQGTLLWPPRTLRVEWRKTPCRSGRSEPGAPRRRFPHGHGCLPVKACCSQTAVPAPGLHVCFQNGGEEGVSGAIRPMALQVPALSVALAAPSARELTPLPAPTNSLPENAALLATSGVCVAMTGTSFLQAHL